MRFVVKNTTRISWFDLICPYSCRGCGQLGDVLCECCKKNLLSKKIVICPLCKKELAGKNKNDEIVICDECELPFRAVVVGGWREGVLAKVIKEYKYQAVKRHGVFLVEMLDRTLDRVFPESTKDKRIVVVPLPTIGRHVRERGFDHTLDLAKRLVKRRDWEMERLLFRRTNTVQVGASMKERQAQALEAYGVAGRIDPDSTYVLLDDIWTTGASMISAGKILQKAGAQDIMAVIIATGRADENSD